MPARRGGHTRPGLGSRGVRGLRRVRSDRGIARTLRVWTALATLGPDARGRQLRGPDGRPTGDTSPALDETLAPGLSRTGDSTPSSADPATVRDGQPQPPVSGLEQTAVGSGVAARSSSGPEALAALLTREREPGRIGRFAVLRRIGAGGMGVVYAAYDEELDRKIAIKVVREEIHGVQGRSRMQREAQAMARLSHPNVVQVYEAGEFAGQVFVAMEFIKGQNLSEWLAAEERPWEEILEVFLQAGRGLAAAHRQGLVHRDFKPSQGRFERVDVDRAAPGRPGVPHVLAKRWQRAGPPEDQRGHGPRNTCWCVVGPLPIMTDAVQRFTSAVPRRKPCGQ
jgi:hypothetical protein